MPDITSYEGYPLSDITKSQKWGIQSSVNPELLDEECASPLAGKRAPVKHRLLQKNK